MNFKQKIDGLKSWQKLLILVGAVLLLTLILLLISWIITRREEAAQTTVLGVDVSTYQGDIDWPTIESQGIHFAYIKATEGEDYTDDRFEENWTNIDQTDILKGAYMFWCFDEDGEAQADYFISVVPDESGTLPPVIDLELYGDYSDNPLPKNQVLKNLNKTIEKLQEAYGTNPIIYTNYRTYDMYLSDADDEIPIWICDISNNAPTLEGEHDWIFWQFSQRGILDGYTGGPFIDMDLYNGTLRELKSKV